MSIASIASGQLATISRKTTTPDAMGGAVDTYDDVYTDVVCNIQPRNAKMGLRGDSGTMTERDRREMDVTHVLYTATPLALVTGDRLVSSGLTYLVQSFADTAGRGRLYVAHLLQKS